MIKRIFDISLSFFGFFISSPVWLFIGLLICIEDGFPIFYLQERVGRDGKIFKALKFRSMEKDAEKEIGPVQAKENDYRVTRIGKILRATAMDELPQLWNILKGDMSFVGPRAMRPAEIEASNWQKIDEKHKTGDCKAENGLRNPDYNCEAVPLEEIPGYFERQRARPGLTGIAQLFTPRDMPRVEKFKYDLFYLKKQSFWLDLRLIILSFWVTFRGKWEAREKKFKKIYGISHKSRD